MLIETREGMLDVEQEGQGRDLLLLHSLLADRQSFEAVRPALAKHYRLSVVNLPGYGQSTPHEASIEGYADQIADLMARLHLSPQTAVLGNGLGGFISVALAIRHGQKFERLIVADALAGFPEPGKVALRTLAGRIREGGMAAGLEAAIQRMFPPPFMQAYPDVVTQRKQGLLKMDPSVFSHYCLALTNIDFEPLLPRIKNSVLVMVGALDGTTNPQLVQKLAAGIPGARFMTIQDSGHCPQIEQPKIFCRLIDEFLLPPGKAL